MAEPDLPYGHFGLAEYDPEDHEWHFVRSRNNYTLWSPLGGARTIIHPSLHPNLEQPLDGIPSQKLPKQVQHLLKSHPEFGPALDLLAPLAHLSEAVETAASKYDPLEGILLDFGSVRSEADQHLVEIAAFASGTTGGDLRLVQTRKQRRGWRDSKDAWLEMPIIHGEEAIWRGEGAPVQQVCFGKTVDPGQNFLAVRMHSRTILYRPMVRRAVLPGTQDSRLDPNPVFELPWKKTGEAPHAHVSFNPWFNRQFGIVDQAGICTIWELTGWSNMNAKCIFKSAIEDDCGEDNVLDDGWSRILWAGGPMTIAMCTRRKLLLLNLHGDATKVAGIDIYQSDKAGWLLDMSSFPLHLDHLCVLTPTHILIFRITNAHAVPAALEVLRLRHYRNPDDLTLALMFDAFQQTVAVKVRSRLEQLITEFELAFDGDNGIKVYEPRHFILPSDIDATTVVGWHMKTVPVEKREKARDDIKLLTWQEQDIHFASLFAMRRDLSISQVLYITNGRAGVSAPTEPPSWERKLNASTPRVRTEAFVFDDDKIGSLEDDQYERRARPVPVHVKRRILQTRSVSKSAARWTVNFEWIVRQLQNEQVVETQAFNAVVDRAKDLLQNQPVHVAPLRTLADLAKGELAVDDIEDASQRLTDLAMISRSDRLQQSQGYDQAPPALATRLALRAVHLPHSQTTQEGAEPQSLLDIYNRMVDDWITPLPAHVPGKVRLAKEKLVRQTAAEVALASRVIHTEEISEPVQTQQQPSQAFDLPVRAGLSISALESMSSQPLPESSQSGLTQRSVLPTPSATPSLATGTSYTTSFEAPEISRLSKYTTFSAPAPSALPRSLNLVLSHWDVGTDPAEYDWLRSTRQISQRQEAEDLDETLDEREREKLRRRAERLLRRQRREAEASEAARLASSQAPQLASYTGPQSQSQSRPQSGRGLGGDAPPSVTQVVPQRSQSQGFGMGMGSAGQVVPGRYGGRPAKKKRKQGF